MGEGSFNLDDLHQEAIELEGKAKELEEKGLVSDIQEGVDLEVIKQSKIEQVEKELKPAEKEYFSPEKEFDTEEYIAFLRNRDLKIEKQAQQNLSDQHFASVEEHKLALEDEVHRLKYFPVLFVSAPHVGEDVSGIFPGEPTPLMYATSVLDRYVRTDTFPAKTSPEIVGMMNPGQFDEGFVKQLIDRIKTEKPRAVGISNTSEGHFFAGEIAEIIKIYSPETLIILGGSHEDGVNAEAYLNLKSSAMSAEKIQDIRNQASLQDERMRDRIDIVVAGDSPYALAEIFKVVANNKDKTNAEISELIANNEQIFSNIEGVGTISVKDKENRVKSIPLSGTPLDWNKLPLMFRGRLTSENRFPLFNNKKTAQIMTQMGCKYACSFCMESLSGELYQTSKCNQPSIEKALQEIKILIKDYQYEAVFFDDSTFTQNHKRTEQLLNGIAALNEQDVKFEWGCQTSFADIPDKELLEKMHQTGCSYIYFGFEQLEEKIKGHGKGVQMGKVEQVLDWCKQIGIRTGVSLQFGLEGMGYYQDTIDYVAGLYKNGLISKNLIAININTPYPGTKEWLDLEKRPDFNQPLDRHPRFEVAHQLSNLTTNKVNEIYAYARKKIGDGLIGVEYDNQEIQQHLEKYRQRFGNDFYFDSAKYKEYLYGEIKALHLNHASVTNRPNEIKELTKLTAEFSDDDWIKVEEEARSKAAELVGIRKEGVIFGRNTTETMKLISWLAGIKKGDRVMLTNAENQSIVRLFEMNMDQGNPEGEDQWSTYPTFYQKRGKKYGDIVEELTGVETDVINVVNETLENTYANIERNLTPETKCFVISHVIRDTGVALPVKEICEFVRAKKRGINPNDPDIFVIIDGAQALGNLPKVNFAELGCDAYVGTPHKTMGSTPVGLGFFNQDNPLIKKNLPKLNKLFWQDQQVILKGMFDSSLGVKPNVEDEIDRMDIFGFKHAVDHLSEKGYKNGNFEEIDNQRKGLKQHFRSLMSDLAGEQELHIAEVNNGTNFIYSFSIPGINNREFAHALSERGIFVSYIHRTKLQTNNENYVGNGLIRVSFSADNTISEINDFRTEIKNALSSVVEAEFARFETEAERRVIFSPANISVAGWLNEKIKSPITKVAIAATIFLMILSHEVANDRSKMKIDLDERFVKLKQAALVHYQHVNKSERELFKNDKFKQHAVLEQMSMSERMIEKYKLLSRLDDENKINTILDNDVSVQVAASLEYSENEINAITNVYKQTENKRLRQLLNLIRGV